MEWWQILIIVVVGGAFLDNIIVNICRAVQNVQRIKTIGVESNHSKGDNKEDVMK